MLVSEEGNQAEEEPNDSIVNIAGLWRHKAWQHTVYSPEIIF